jgi:DNA mismatch repair protein MutL
VPPPPCDSEVTCPSPVSDPFELDEPAPETLQTPPIESRVGAVLSQLAQDQGFEPLSASSKSSPKQFGKLKFLAQVRLTFLVCEGDDGLYVIDQHAAAERVAFAKLLSQYHSRAMSAQALLFPVMVDLLPREVELLDAQQEVFRALGLDVRVRGPERVSVHSIPRLLQQASPERLVRDLLGEMTKSGGRGFTSAVEQAIALMACHGSLRAGEMLTAVQAQGLLTSLDEVDIAPQCMHGRPVVAVMRFTDLERQVGRR